MKYHNYNFLCHALPLSYSSFTRGQNQTGDFTTRVNTLYAFFCNTNIFLLVLKEIHYTHQNLNDSWAFLLSKSSLEQFPNRQSSYRPSPHPHILATTHFSKCSTITPYLSQLTLAQGHLHYHCSNGKRFSFVFWLLIGWLLTIYLIQHIQF